MRRKAALFLRQFGIIAVQTFFGKLDLGLRHINAANRCDNRFGAITAAGAARCSAA